MCRHMNIKILQKINSLKLLYHNRKFCQAFYNFYFSVVNKIFIKNSSNY